jgi:hypothetical protein
VGHGRAAAILQAGSQLPMQDPLPPPPKINHDCAPVNCIIFDLSVGYAQGHPMVLNHNRYTHCGWTNGSTGRASNIVLDPREPPDDGEGDFRELHTRCVVTLAGGTVR